MTQTSKNMIESELPLTNLQREMLSLFALNLNAEQLSEIKKIILEYLGNLSIETSDEAWDKNGWCKENTLQLLDSLHERKQV